MKEFKSPQTDALRRFAKDKRVRIHSAEPVARTTGAPARRTEGGSSAPAPRRRSFNPNFTADNRLVPAAAEQSRQRDVQRAGDKTPQQRYGKPSGRFAAKRPSAGHPAAKSQGRPKPRAMKSGESSMGQYPSYAAPEQNGAIRLNRYVAMSGICSRREADEFIQAGVVSVNGQVVTSLGTKVNPGDEVRFNDRRLSGQKKVYILMNKPKGYVTSIEDPHADKLVMDIVRNACTERVYPVGRLDKNSVGVLLITNDGELTRQLTHPSYNKRKVYEVTLDKALTQEHALAITEGIELEDGVIAADELAFGDKSRKVVGIEIHSGRNRIVRRIFEHFGYGVTKLDRVYFAGLTKKNLKRGQWRFLTDSEVRMLKRGLYE